MTPSVFETAGKKEYTLEPEEINLREIARYLGYRNETPDERVGSGIESAVSRLAEVSRAKAVWQSFPLTEENGRLLFAGMGTESRDLAVNLKNCSSVILFAATLGSGPDILIRRAQIGRISDAVILQSASAAMIEAVCDRLNEELREEAEKAGFTLHPRYSPGYGDFSLEYQKDLIRILNAGKEIGLSLTEGLLMTPGKSVTAVIGAEISPKSDET